MYYDAKLSTVYYVCSDRTADARNVCCSPQTYPTKTGNCCTESIAYTCYIRYPAKGGRVVGRCSTLLLRLGYIIILYIGTYIVVDRF